MDEVSEAETGKQKKKPGGDGKAGVEGMIGRMLVRAIWAQEWTLANPEGKAEERKAAWRAAREATIEKNLKIYRRALNALTRSGVTITMIAAAEASADEDDGGED